jgi:hypothetical protein
MLVCAITVSTTFAQSERDEFLKSQEEKDRRQTITMLAIVGGAAIVGGTAVLIAVKKGKKDKKVEEVQRISNEQSVADAIYKNYSIKRLEADSLHKNGKPFLSAKCYSEYLKSIEMHEFSKGLGGPVSFDDPYKDIHTKLYSDTIGIGDTIGNCKNEFKTQHQNTFSQIETELSQKNSFAQKYNQLLKSCGVLVLSGEVTDIDGDKVQLFGKALPPTAWATQNTLAGAFAYELSGDDRSNEAEGVPGAVLENSNIIILKYDQKSKISGSAIVGKELAVQSYCYKSRTTATNAFGAEVPVRIYEPCKCMDELESLDSLYSGHSIKAMELITKDLGISIDDYKHYFSSK